MTREQWLERCGVGARYWDACRERLREPQVICAYLDELEERVKDGRGLLLLGPIGVGKTAALALIARDAQGKTPGAWYVTVTRLIGHLLRQTELRREMVYRRAEYNLPKGREEVVDPKLWPLLLLDEFGAAYESDYAMAALEDYLGWRYDHKLATCVASNLTPEQIRRNPHYARLVDRWRETCDVVVIGGPSQRRATGE